MYAKLRWILRYYRGYPHVVALLLVLTPLQLAIGVHIPRLVGFTVDYVKTGALPEHWLGRGLVGAGAGWGLSPAASLGLGFIALGLAAVALYACFQSWRAWMNVRLEWLFRQVSFDQVTAKGPDFFNRFRTGDLVTRMTDDVAEKLSWFACSGIWRLYEALLAVAFVLIMMVSIDPALTVWTAGPLPLLILIFFRSSSALDRRYDALQKRISRVNDVAEACFSGVRVLKAYVREPAQQRRFEGAARERQAAEIASVRAAAIVDSLYNYIWQFGVVIVLFAGGYKVLRAGLSIGDMATFIYYVVWLVFPMFDIGQFLVKSRQSAVSIDRLVELEAVPPMVRDEGIGGAVAGAGDAEGRGAALRFEQVGFAFPGSPRRILEDISFEVAPGEIAAVVGRVGAGKSWLVHLVPRLVDPTEGRITLDGRDLRAYRLEALRGMIGFVPQEPALFSDTVRQNILFGRPGISDERLAWALEVAQLREEVEGFPQGLDTPIGTRGMSISGGQKQRLSLARALVGRPRILILDDCTSALDSRTEAALWERLHEVLPGMTALLVTHRPDTLQRADRIFVLAGGRLVESGSHATLIGRPGEYARVYRRLELAGSLA
ncbi:MAG: ABC transporter ATP-binding protein [Candidatus Eisenbacteria bacterium]|uniref:ABC transporter ATP-binding protein n=1 Tax=Eiseniibacteriota bacterium TaxID=2212470 RepID=A0A938BKU5_UNCEI|nr:ABC transporter ATP-binding protein [Candidatus Eisenbacteria bacterium]